MGTSYSKFNGNNSSYSNNATTPTTNDNNNDANAHDGFLLGNTVIHPDGNPLSNDPPMVDAGAKSAPPQRSSSKRPSFGRETIVIEGNPSSRRLKATTSSSQLSSSPSVSSKSSSPSLRIRNSLEGGHRGRRSAGAEGEEKIAQRQDSATTLSSFVPAHLWAPEAATETETTATTTISSSQQDQSASKLFEASRSLVPPPPPPPPKSPVLNFPNTPPSYLPPLSPTRDVQARRAAHAASPRSRKHQATSVEARSSPSRKGRPPDPRDFAIAPAPLRPTPSNPMVGTLRSSISPAQDGRRSPVPKKRVQIGGAIPPSGGNTRERSAAEAPRCLSPSFTISTIHESPASPVVHQPVPCPPRPQDRKPIASDPSASTLDTVASTIASSSGFPAMSQTSLFSSASSGVSTLGSSSAVAACNNDHSHYASLLTLVARRDWAAVAVRCVASPREVHVFHRVQVGGTERILLPLHLACTLDPPVQVIKLLLRADMETSVDTPNRMCLSPMTLPCDGFGGLTATGGASVAMTMTTAAIQRTGKGRYGAVRTFNAAMKNIRRPMRKVAPKRSNASARNLRAASPFPTMHLVGDGNDEEDDSIVSCSTVSVAAGVGRIQMVRSRSRRQVMRAGHNLFDRSTQPLQDEDCGDIGSQEESANDQQLVAVQILTNGTVVRIDATPKKHTDVVREVVEDDDLISIPSVNVRFQESGRHSPGSDPVADDDLLPIHLACLFRSSPKVIQALLKRYPEGARMENQWGMLPIHIVCAGVVADSSTRLFPALNDTPSVATNSCNELNESSSSLKSSKKRQKKWDLETVVRNLVQAHPRSVHVRSSNSDAKTPIQYVQETMDDGSVKEAILKLMGVDQGDEEDDEPSSPRSVMGKLDLPQKSSPNPLALHDYLVKGVWSRARNHLEACPRDACVPMEHRESSSGLLPLQVALRVGAPASLIRRLLDAYPEAAKVSTVIGTNELLPLHLSCQRGAVCCKETVHALIKCHPPSVAETDGWGRLPLQIACAHGANVSVVRLLDQTYPCGRTHKDFNGHSAVTYAELHGTIARPVVDYLLDNHDGDFHCVTSSTITSIPEDPTLVEKEENKGDEEAHAEDPQVCDGGDDHTVGEDSWQFGDDFPAWEIAQHLSVNELFDCHMYHNLPRRILDHPQEAHALSDDPKTGWAVLPIHRACVNYCSADVVRALLDAHPVGVQLRTNPVGSTLRDSITPCGQETPLHLACRYGTSSDVIELLLDAYPRGAETTNEVGQVPLHVACMTGAVDVAVVRVLIRTVPATVKYKDFRGRTPLSYAAASPHPYRSEVIALLEQSDICYGHNELLKYVVCRQWANAIIRAREAPYEAMARIGPTVEIKNLFSEVRANNGFVLHRACALRSPKAVIEAICSAYPPAVRTKNHDGRYPLHLACLFGASDDVVRFLLQLYPASVSGVDRYGRLPLHLACLEGASLDVIRPLIAAAPGSYGAKDKRGWTPFEFAALTHPHDTSILEALLSSTSRRRLLAMTNISDGSLISSVAADQRSTCRSPAADNSSVGSSVHGGTLPISQRPSPTRKRTKLPQARTSSPFQQT